MIIFSIWSENGSFSDVVRGMKCWYREFRMLFRGKNVGIERRMLLVEKSIGKASLGQREGGG